MGVSKAMLLKAHVFLTLAGFCLASPNLERIFRKQLEYVLNLPPHLVNASLIPDEFEILLPYTRHLNLKDPQPLPLEAFDPLCSACIVGLETFIDLVLLDT